MRRSRSARWEFNLLNTRMAAAAFMLTAVGASAAPPSESPATAVFRAVSKSVVVVLAIDADSQVQLQGSGVVISRGVVATNCHVLRGAYAVSVKYAGKDWRSNIKAMDPDRDVCTLDVRGLPARPVRMLDSDAKLQVGQSVYAVGAPEGLELTLSQGIISALRKCELPQLLRTLR